MDVREMTALEIGALIRNREISSPEVVKVYLDAIDKDDTNAFITVFDDAIKRAEKVQDRLDEFNSPLAGVPVGIKDNLCMKGSLTTAGSKILSNFKPPYTATVVEKLQDAGAVVLGKTNLDEFAMGGSTETSYYGASKNPWDQSRVPGGSSGGSAAAVAAELSPYALGSDTGGSIRQPCAFNNLTGVKPTYGSVSRYGLMAYASSLDQVGPMAKDAKDCEEVLKVISGYDEKDSTSIKGFEAETKDGDLKIGIPKNYMGKGLDREVRENLEKAAKDLESLGAKLEYFDLPLIEYAVPTYYIIACAEASSNLSRYDGVKYGFRSKEAQSLLDIYYKSRTEGFGDEVKRRVMLGSFVLSSGYFDAYYKKALKVRRLIKNAFDEAFGKYDIILSPVAPTPPYKIGEQIDDPLAMYLADIYTISINLAGLPSVALPSGFTEDGLPTGMQLIGREFNEGMLIDTAKKYQEVTTHHRERGAK